NNATLTLDTANNGLGTWTLLSGTVVGGHIATANGAVLQLLNNGNPTSGTLNNVTIDAGSKVTASGGHPIPIVNGLTINGRVDIPSGGNIKVSGTQTIGGTGDIFSTDTGSGGGTAGGVIFTTNGTALTLGPGFTFHGGYTSFSNGTGV